MTNGKPEGDGRVPDKDSEVYHPPSGAKETDQLDADVNGTSASHYGTNDPEQLKERDQPE